MFAITRVSIKLLKHGLAQNQRRFLHIIAMASAEEKPFVVEYAAQGRAKCKTCKQQIEKNSKRIGKLISNPFSEDGGIMKQWYHVRCIFESLSRARATTKKIDSTDDLDGFDKLNDDDQKEVKGLIKGLLFPVGFVSVSRPCQYFHSKVLKFKRSPCTGYHFQAVGL